MSLGEFALIDRYFRKLGVARDDVVLGVGDDGALLRPPAGVDLVAVSDTLVEGVHFPSGAAARSVGHRALAVNLSDIAAMGAVPAWSLLALTLPAVDESWLEEFAAGFGNLALAHGVALVGGDTTRGPLMLGVQVLGFVPRGQGLRRAGGKPGDLLCVSGTPGDAAAGLALLQQTIRRPPAGDNAAELNQAAQQLQQRFEFPTPRLALGKAFLDLATACIDISDGLLGDVGKLAAASACTAILDLERLPRSAALSTLVDGGCVTEQTALRYVLAGGDDYELVFAVPAAKRASLDAHLECGNITIIGELVGERIDERIETQGSALASNQASSVPVRLRRDGAWLASAEFAALTAGFDHFTA